jgi:hypothetical protein
MTAATHRKIVLSLHEINFLSCVTKQYHMNSGPRPARFERFIDELGKQIGIGRDTKICCNLLTGRTDNRAKQQHLDIVTDYVRWGKSCRKQSFAKHTCSCQPFIGRRSDT